MVELHSFWNKERKHMTPRGSFGPRFLKNVLKGRVSVSEKYRSLGFLDGECTSRLEDGEVV